MDTLTLLYILLIIITIALIALIVYIVKNLLKREQNWKKGAIPTEEEINNEKVNELANSLRRKTDKETLINILEWQQRNINFWLERFPMPLITGAFLIGLVISSVFLSFSIILWSGAWLTVCLLFFFMFLAMMVTSIAITLVTICYGRRLHLSQFWNTIRASVQINDILENRLCVCKDYAKLTACLLLNINHDSEVYFAHTSNHVAVGIVSKGQLYMLDQRLPILTIGQWDKHEKSKETIHKWTHGEFILVEDISNFIRNNQSLSELIKQLKDSGITISSTTNAKPIKVIKWRKGAFLYSMNDENVNYSLAQLIKYEVTNDLLDFEKIRFEIRENDSDLEFLIKNQ